MLLHELRTHLAILKTSLELALLKGKDVSSPELSQTLKKCIDHVDQLTRLLEDM